MCCCQSSHSGMGLSLQPGSWLYFCYAPLAQIHSSISNSDQSQQRPFSVLMHRQAAVRKLTVALGVLGDNFRLRRDWYGRATRRSDNSMANLARNVVSENSLSARLPTRKH